MKLGCLPGRGPSRRFFVHLALWAFFDLLVVWSVVGLLVFWSFGLSLLCYRSISVPPVRGGTYFSLPAAKKSRQKKAAQTASS